MAQKKKSDSSSGGSVDLLDEEKSKDKVKPPSKYQVVFYNDDYTPMDLVAILLSEVFHHGTEAAWKITMDIHVKGKGIAGGPYSKEIAETKAQKVVMTARAMGYPLLAQPEKT